MTGAQAAEAVRASFEQAANRLPFRAIGDDVFIQSVRLNENQYRIYLVDPGWLDPADRKVSLKVQFPGEWALRDLLSGEAIAQQARQASLAVPAGSRRILKAVKHP